MICYKDRTFCSFYHLCRDGYLCPRAFTEGEKKRSIVLGLPVSLFMDKPECFRSIDEKGWEDEDIKDAYDK